MRRANGALRRVIECHGLQHLTPRHTSEVLSDHDREANLRNDDSVALKRDLHFLFPYSRSTTMTLVVDNIKCVEESDEVGADDIYLIAFIGRTVPPFRSALGSIGPAGVWSDFDTGETHGADVSTGLFTASDAVY